MTDLDLARLLRDLDRDAIFPGKGAVNRQRIADALTDLTGARHVVARRPSGVLEVRRADEAV